MPRIEVTKTIAATRDTVYAKIFDYEKLPTFSTIVTAAKVVGREGNTEVVEQEGKMLGRRFRIKVRATRTPPEKLVEEVVEGDASGTQTWVLREVPGGTEIRLISDITPKGFLARLFGGLATGPLQRVVEHEAEAIRKYVESGQ